MHEMKPAPPAKTLGEQVFVSGLKSLCLEQGWVQVWSRDYKLRSDNPTACLRKPNELFSVFQAHVKEF